MSKQEGPKVRLKRWMIVDDDVDDQFFFELALDKIDSDVDLLKANNGKECIEMLRQATKLPDIIFLDINMPVMDGRQCLSEIRADHRFDEIRIIIYTTSSDPTDQLMVKEMGADACLTKAHTIQELVVLIEQTISQFENHVPDNQG